MIYDAIVIGSGAGGGITAAVLAEGGMNVLVLERGRNKSFAEVGRDHLRNHRLSVYGQNQGPEDNALDSVSNPRVFVNADGQEQTVKPFEGNYNNNAMGVGGGTKVYGGQAWRFLPTDFRMASTYGVPEGSSLADWPVTYDDLAPYYERAEWEIGVSADSELMAKHWPRRKGYPMPAVPLNTQGQIFRAGASQLGWDVFPVPLLLNTTPYQNRAACIACQHCVGFACPVDAKNGTQNTMLPRAINTGRCILETEAMVTMIDSDGSGKVVGVTYVNKEGQRVSVKAGIVVCSAGAIETARLLLHSKNQPITQWLGQSGRPIGAQLARPLLPRHHGSHGRAGVGWHWPRRKHRDGEMEPRE